MAKLSFEFFDKGDKKRILKELSGYGIEKIPYLIIKWGKRLRMFSGSIDKETIFSLMRELNVDSIGLYFASTEDGLRLSTDAVHILSKQITNGILEIDNPQAEQWFRGKSIELNEGQKGIIEPFRGKFVILKNGYDFIGAGKKSFNGIANFMPKERRIKH